MGRDDEGVPGGTADAVDRRHPHACGQLVLSGPADREQPPPRGLLDAGVRHGRGAPSWRWTLTHLIEETGRHAGHADILRELIDGATGR